MSSMTTSGHCADKRYRGPCLRHRDISLERESDLILELAKDSLKAAQRDLDNEKEEATRVGTEPRPSQKTKQEVPPLR